MSGKHFIGWVVMLAILGGGWFYLRHEKSKPIPSPPPEKPVWSLRKYDSGKFYFKQDFLTEYRAVCESADCTPLLDKVQVGLLGTELNDVKREGLHLIVKQNGVEYHFKVEAMGEDIVPAGNANTRDDSQ